MDDKAEAGNMPSLARKGRGAVTNPAVRFESQAVSPFDDGWNTLTAEFGDLPKLATTLTRDASRSAIAWNSSPDIGFDRAVNPYRGCEHGCIYCYARPTHAYLGLSPGLDFESRLFFKPRAAELLTTELSSTTYRCAPLALGTNTDPYQPVERELGIMRSILEVLRDLRDRSTSVALILADDRMPRMRGTDLLEQSRELAPDARRVEKCSPIAVYRGCSDRSGRALWRNWRHSSGNNRAGSKP